MRGLDLRGRICFIIVCVGLLLSACQDVNEPEAKNYSYIVSHTSKAKVSLEEIKFKISWAKSVYPDIGPFSALVKSDIDVEKITYNTTFLGQKIQASGLVYLPKVAGNYPVLCFQNGTNTLYSQAPSMNSESGVLSILESVASMGYIVVVPDYIGFGESQQLPHPFLHASSTVKSILDMLRAVRELTTEENSAAKSTKDLFIFGYSLGGWATMLLQKEIETNFSGEFNLKASACAAGPYSLEYMNQYITGLTNYPNPYFLAYLLNAYTAIGIVDNPLSDFINQPYASLIPGLYDGKHSGASINASLTTRIDTLLTSDYRTRCISDPKFASFNQALIDNSVKVSDWKISTPTSLFHGSADSVVPASMSEKIMQDMLAAGNSEEKVKLIIIPNVGHSDGIMPVGISTIQWFLEMNK
ncbi:MAG: alpha/beta hydrolase family protein [Bacteroidales bacterium]